jgi:hypothetical protein
MTLELYRIKTLCTELEYFLRKGWTYFVKFNPETKKLVFVVFKMPASVVSVIDEAYAEECFEHARVLALDTKDLNSLEDGGVDFITAFSKYTTAKITMYRVKSMIHRILSKIEGKPRISMGATHE